MTEPDDMTLSGASSLPPELADRPRVARPIAWRTGWARVWTWILSLSMLSTGAAGLVFWIGAILWCLIGVDHPGTVRGVRRAAGSKSTSYYVYADYTIAGQSLSDEFGITEGEFIRQSAAGSGFGPGLLPGVTPGGAVVTPPLRLRTLTLGPWRFTYAVSFDESLAGKFLFASFLPAIGLIFLVWGLWMAVLEPRRVAWLCREGVASPGVITRKWAVTGKSTTYYISLEFITPEGERVKAEQTLSKPAYALATPNQVVTVLHPEGKKKPAVVYELSGYRCE